MDQAIEHPVVETKQGPLRGARKGTVSTFFGVPYAAAPARWAAPGPHAGWQDVRDATSFGASAWQNDPESPFMTPVGEKSEDCLFLNVTTPGADDQKRPVMVWIHGGAFVTGAGSQALYRADWMVDHGDVVVVTINYRLGALGFLNLAAVTGGKIESNGTLGLQDQVAALKWVRDNIEAFGGDRDNVTIFGESAGGMSVGSLLAMPEAAGLFHKAIPQSGACHTALTPDRSEAVAASFVKAAGLSASDIDGLMGLDPSHMMKLQLDVYAAGLRDKTGPIGVMPFQPSIGSADLPELPINAIRKGASKDVQIMTGTTLNEWTFFGLMDQKIMSMDKDSLIRRVGHLLPDTDAAVLVATFEDSLKARGADHAPGDIFIAIQTDRKFRAPADRLLEALDARGTPGHGYLFTQASPLFDGKLGACHALEIGYVFGSYQLPKADAFFGSGPQVARVSEAMMSAWVNFARSGNPSGGACPDWPSYNRDDHSVMRFGADIGAKADPLQQEREAFVPVPDHSVGNS